MKKPLLMSAVLALAACGEKKADEAPPAETTGEMAAPADTGMGGMSHDSAMSSDTTMARDTASTKRHDPAGSIGPRAVPGARVFPASSSSPPNGSCTTLASRPPATTLVPGSTSRRMIARPRVRPSTVKVERTVPTSLSPASTPRPSGAPGSRQARPRSSRLV